MDRCSLLCRNGYEKRAPAKRRSAERFRHSVCRKGRGTTAPGLKKGTLQDGTAYLLPLTWYKLHSAHPMGCTPFRRTANSYYGQYTTDRQGRARGKYKTQKCSCWACRAAISGGISCFLRLTTPGSTALPSLGSTPKASRTIFSAPWPQNIRSVAWFCMSVNI